MHVMNSLCNNPERKFPSSSSSPSSSPPLIGEYMRHRKFKSFVHSYMVCMSARAGVWGLLQTRCSEQLTMVHAKSSQLCPTPCNPTDYSSPGSSVHGILQARILAWVAMLFSNRSSLPRDRTRVSYVSCICRQVLYHLMPPGKPNQGTFFLKSRVSE